MKKNKFKLLFIIVVIILLAAILFSPSIYEEAKKSPLLPGTHSQGFYSCYSFSTVDTRLYNDSKYTKTFDSVTDNNARPVGGFYGTIKIAYYNSTYFNLKSTFIDEANHSLQYVANQYFKYNSNLGPLFFPHTELNHGATIAYLNGTTGTVTGKNQAYNYKMFSREGIVSTTGVALNDMEYSKTEVPSCFSYAKTPSGGNILAAMTFSGVLYQFTEIFPAYNNSAELTLSLNQTNVNLQPLELWQYYIAPNIFTAIIVSILAIPVYALTTISIRRKK